MSSLREDLNLFIYQTAGGKEIVDLLKKQITPQTLVDNNVIEKRHHSQLSMRQQERINTQRYVKGFHLAHKTSNPELAYKHTDYFTASYGLSLNTMAFLATIELLGNQQQVKHWKNQVISGRAFGAYGQTQLGHGSNVQGLQTTAVYQPQTQQFVINSPARTSLKFWPGVMGHYSTHAVIQAKTTVKGKSIGVQTFVIQLRDSKLRALQGVQVFDIGPKLGFQRVDNGAVGFKNVRIPLNSMLMRYHQVTSEGQVLGLENKSALKYGYGSMLNLRVRLVSGFAMSHIIYPTIHLSRVLQRQGTAGTEANRRMITQWLCLGLGIVLANKNTHNIFSSFLEEINNKNYEKGDKLLVSCHIISSTLKALVSRIGIDVLTYIVTCNPLSKFSASMIPFYFTYMVPSTTYEGDNTVLLQQTAKYLLFKFNPKDQQVQKCFRNDEWEKAALALQVIIGERLANTKKRIEEDGDKGIQFNTIWNERQQVNLIQISVLWGYMTLLKSITLILPTVPNHKAFYSKVCAVMTSYIVQRVKEWPYFGFEIENVEPWKQLSTQQVQAILNMKGVIQTSSEPLQLISREGQWLHAKL